MNDATGAGFSCDDVDLELGCIYSEGLLVLDASVEEIAAAVVDVEQTFTGTGGIFATDLVDLAVFEVALVTAVFDLSAIVPNAFGGGAVVTPPPDGDGAAIETPVIETPPPAVETPPPAEAPPAAEDDAAACHVVTVTVPAAAADAIVAANPTAVVVGAVEDEVVPPADEVVPPADEVEPPAETPVATPEPIVEDGEAAEEGGDVEEGDELEEGDDAEEEDNLEEGEELEDDNGDDAEIIEDAPAAGNLQTFTGELGGPAPPVEDSGDANRPFTVNGATFTAESTALIRSCDIQNNQCFNAVNGGELAGGTEQCSQQLDECRAVADAAAARKRNVQARRDLILGGGGLGELLGGGRGGGLAGGRGGGKGRGGKGGLVGGAKGPGAGVPPPPANDQLVLLEITQCV